MSYNKLVEQHFFEPLNLFKSNDCNSYTTVKIGSKKLGDAIKIYLLCDLKTRRIHKIKYEVYGNPYLVAALSYLSDSLQGELVSKINLLSDDLINTLELPKTKFYCAYMVEDAVNQVIQKWRENHD